MTRDLTRGRPMGLILGFGIPVLFGYLFQQLYSVIDTAIVGKTLGGAALAAVGSTGAISFLVVGFCCGICSGFAIPVAQQFGADNGQELRRYVTGGVWLCAAFGAVLTVATVALCPVILTRMNTPADIYQRAYQYIVTIFAGLPAVFLYNFTAGVLRSLGDSRTPVLWQVAASLTNIVLDVVFILVFRLDVFGAALATVLSQVLAGAGCLVRMGRGYPVLRMEKADWRPERRRMGELCMMGLPMGLQYSITAVGSVMIQSAVNSLGTVYVGAVTAAGRVTGVLACTYDAMGCTMATYGGQNVGARQWERLHEGVRACTILAAGYSLLIFGAVFFFAGPMLMVFLSADSAAALLPLARRYLLINVAFYFPLALVNIFRFMIQGMGFSPLAVLAGVMEMVGRWGVALLVPFFGFTAAAFASPAAWILADLFLVPAYFHCCRRLTRPRAPRRRKVQAAVKAG